MRKQKDIARTEQSIAILFLDIKNFSKLQGKKMFATFGTEIMSDLNERIKERIAVNTWGDAIMAAFPTADAAAATAIVLRDYFLDEQFMDKFSVPELGVRIALHFGKAVIFEDPITKQANVIGEEVNWTARIEPIVPVNHIFMTEAFRAQLKKANLRAIPAGTYNLPKGAGPAKLFCLKRATEKEDLPQQELSPVQRLAMEEDRDRATIAETLIDRTVELILANERVDEEEETITLTTVSEKLRAELALSPTSYACTVTTRRTNMQVRNGQITITMRLQDHELASEHSDYEFILGRGLLDHEAYKSLCAKADGKDLKRYLSVSNISGRTGTKPITFKRQRAICRDGVVILRFSTEYEGRLDEMNLELSTYFDSSTGWYTYLATCAIRRQLKVSFSAPFETRWHGGAGLNEPIKKTPSAGKKHTTTLTFNETVPPGAKIYFAFMPTDKTLARDDPPSGKLRRPSKGIPGELATMEKLLLQYLRTTGFKQVSFARLREHFGEKYSDDMFRQLIESAPNRWRPAKLTRGARGIAPIKT